MYELHIEPKFAKRKRIVFEKGHVPFNKGMKINEYLSEDKQKIVLSNLEKGRYVPTRNRNMKSKKPVTAYMLDGSYLKTYTSLHEAARELELFSTTIGQVVRGKRKQCGGYMFRPANIVTDQYGNKCVKKENIEPYTGRFINEY